MKKTILLLSAFFLSSAIIADADDAQWMQVSGNWSVSTEAGTLSDKNTRSRIAGYNEIHNTNSLQSIAHLEKLTQISTEFELFTPMNDNKAMFFFAAPSQKSFYAVRFTGTKEQITSIALIRSEVKDSTLPPTAKDNFIVSELTAKPVTLHWGDPISLEIEIQKKKIRASVGNTTIDYSPDEPLPAGMIGFSHTNNLIRVRSVKAYSGKTVVFEDDFSKDRIKKMTYKAEKVKK